MNISDLILQNLIKNHDYCKCVIPHLKKEYFETDADRKIFETIAEYTQKYLVPPTVDAIIIELSKDKTITESIEKDIDETISKIKVESETQDFNWLVDKTEEYCKERAVYNGLTRSLQIYKDKKNVNQILEIFKDALSVSFDQSIGHSYFDDDVERWEYYNRPENKIPYRIDYLNKITKGGVSRKTVNIIYAPVHAGKTAHMCSLAADNLLSGNNVLYISNEMAAEEIGLRIDVKLLDMSFDDVKSMDKEIFHKKISSIRAKTLGKLIVKQYPTSSAHVGHFRNLLDELKLKQNFIPDIIYIDYLNICASERLKMGTTINSYTVMKAVTEEIRALAIEKDVAVYTATQVNRSSMSSSDIKMEDVSESIGIAHAADLIYSLSADAHMIKKNQILVKQLKNRYSDKSKSTKFWLVFDRSRMNFTDAEKPEEGLIDDVDSNDDDDAEEFENPKPFTPKIRKDFSKFKF